MPCSNTGVSKEWDFGHFSPQTQLQEKTLWHPWALTTLRLGIHSCWSQGPFQPGAEAKGWDAARNRAMKCLVKRRFSRPTVPPGKKMIMCTKTLSLFQILKEMPRICPLDLRWPKISSSYKVQTLAASFVFSFAHFRDPCIGQLIIPFNVVKKKRMHVSK